MLYLNCNIKFNCFIYNILLIFYKILLYAEVKMNLSLPQNIICGYFDCSIFGELKQSPLRVRTLYEIEYYLEDGKLTYSDGIAYPIKKGYIRIGSPGERCNSLLPFKTKYVKFSAEGRLGELLASAPRYFECIRHFEIEKALDEIISLCQAREPDEIMLSGKLLVFISTVIADAYDQRRAKSETILKAKIYIKDHVSETVNLSDIAKFVNLSPNYLHQLFRKTEGITPREYLTEYRLNLACKLLRTTSLPLSEIAERCGFCNQQYMSLLFKKRYGSSPMTYRKDSGRSYLV